MTKEARELGNQPYFPVENVTFDSADGITIRQKIMLDLMVGISSGDIKPNTPDSIVIEGAEILTKLLLEAMVKEPE